VNSGASTGASLGSLRELHGGPFKETAMNTALILLFDEFAERGCDVPCQQSWKPPNASSLTQDNALEQRGKRYRQRRCCRRRRRSGERRPYSKAMSNEKLAPWRLPLHLLLLWSLISSHQCPTRGLLPGTCACSQLCYNRWAKVIKLDPSMNRPST